MNIHALAQQVQDQGYCLFPGIYSSEEIQRMRDLYAAYYEKIGRPALGGFGIGIHPLLPAISEMVGFLARPIVIETAALVVGGPLRMRHAGARLSNETSAPQIGWHHHYHDWDLSSVTRRSRCERVLTAVYVDGSNAQSGPLVVLPRKFNDPINGPLGDHQQDWPGQVIVDAPPGSGIIFDTAMWHTAKRGSARATRHIFGTHSQPWSDTRAHIEDNACDVPEVQKYIDTNPVVRGLLRG